MKFILLKFSVGLIVLQGIVETIMVSFKAEPYSDDSNWSAEDKTIRGYCKFDLLLPTFLTALIS
jgi:hypothetical protein